MWPALLKADQLIKYRKCPVYKPQTGETLPAYFYSMLDDVDRLLKYSSGIRACIQSLPAGKRVVLDLGVGTGMLSALSIHHGADIVVGVDVNDAALNAAEAVMQTLNFQSRFVKLKVTASASTATLREQVKRTLSTTDNQPFDVIVSEILGTLWYGESMRTFVLKYAPLVKLHGGRMHSVPVRCTQYFGIYDFDTPRGLSEAVTYALEQCEDAQEYAPTDKGGIGVALHLYNHASAHHTVRICSCDFSDPRAPVQNDASSVTIGVPSSALRLGVFEWECELWGGVMLKNTIDEYKLIAQTYGQRYALARQSAWGFMICSAREACTINLKFTIGECVEMDVHANSYSCALKDVCVDRHTWICSAADIKLATGIIPVVSHEPDQPHTTIHVVDDVTCGALVSCLLDTFKHASVHVSAMFYPSTIPVLQRIFDAHPRVKLIGARRKRSQLTKATFAIFPSLYHMHKDYATRRSAYHSFNTEIACARHYPNDVRNAQQDFHRSADAGPVGSLRQNANLCGSIPQMLRHSHVHFTTRDFEAPPFWAIEGATDFSIDLNVHHVIGPGPVANLETIENMLRSNETAAAHARLMSGSGLIVRIGHVQDPTAEIDEASSDDDDDDDDDEYKPSRQRQK